MSPTDNQDAEIVFGLVSPVGTDAKRVIDSLTKNLKDTRYDSEIIQLSKFLEKIKGLTKPFSNTDEYERIDSLMTRGNELRSRLEQGNSLVSASVIAIQKFRSTKNSTTKPVPRQTYILKSLKHPKEVSLLRQIYGKSFWLISIYYPENVRKAFLTERIKESRFTLENSSDNADFLINRDQEESGDYGQNVRKTFPLGDVFIDASLDTIDSSMERFIKLVFGYPYHTPTIDEYGMYLAQASALMSSSLARQVGASIMNEKIGVIATGTNEVPYVTGGVCNEDVGSNYREYVKGYDSNTHHKNQLLGNFLQLLKEEGWFVTDKQKDVKELIADVLNNTKLRTAQLMNVTEFGREVHAEMTALMEASRKTISVEGCILYCTTFPCHICAKHIIAAGLKKVVFIEPYHKSLAEDLFSDFINVDKKSDDKTKIQFNPFVGIAPRRYIDIFTWLTRKENDESKMKWDQTTANPRLGEDPSAISKKEDNAATIFLTKMKEKGLGL